MGFLDSIRRWFRSDEPEAAAWTEDDGGAVAVLDAPDPGPAEIEEPLHGWWDEPSEAPARLENNEPIDRTLYERLVHVVDDPELELPRVPQVAQRVLTLLSDENVDFQRLARLTEQDPSLAAEILRVANSLAFRGVSNVSRLDLAFTRIGSRTLRSVVIGASMREFAIRTGGEERTVGEELWRHALAAAATAAALARRLGHREDEMSLAGLLHDVGSLGMLRVVHDYQRTHGRRVGRPLFERLVREWHEHLGVRLAEAWNLPAPLPELIGAHHSLPADDDPYRDQRLMILAADAICAKLRFGGAPPEDLFAEPAFEALGLARNSENSAWLQMLPGEVRERMAGV